MTAMFFLSFVCTVKRSQGSDVFVREFFRIKFLIWQIRIGYMLSESKLLVVAGMFSTFYNTFNDTYLTNGSITTICILQLKLCIHLQHPLIIYYNQKQHHFCYVTLNSISITNSHGQIANSVNYLKKYVVCKYILRMF